MYPKKTQSLNDHRIFKCLCEYGVWGLYFKWFRLSVRVRSKFSGWAVSFMNLAHWLVREKNISTLTNGKWRKRRISISTFRRARWKKRIFPLPFSSSLAWPVFKLPNLWSWSRTQVNKDFLQNEAFIHSYTPIYKQLWSSEKKLQILEAWRLYRLYWVGFNQSVDLRSQHLEA